MLNFIIHPVVPSSIPSLRETVMPPSGFVRQEVQAIGSFAKSILSRFSEEVKDGRHPSEARGIDHELSIIDRELGSNTISRPERGLLQLVREFYLCLKQGDTMEEIVCELDRLSEKNYES